MSLDVVTLEKCATVCDCDNAPRTFRFTGRFYWQRSGGPATNRLSVRLSPR
ncbi:hypothetical protein AWB66_02539 [Caballeronia telluris]|uniref:Uncharacterized protein n=1 Tax=Caballeronia telluris TaxID=326475 RepID=A0A158HR01_9BURK|nr:hypothetical protein AWB66_02539 [Caballeronia telluris]